jgi:hypothetical protein
MISINYKFIFIHVPRTGGRSISNALQPYAKNTIMAHSNLECYINKHPESINYKRFAFVRNPWDRIVSLHRLYCQSDTVVHLHDFVINFKKLTCNLVKSIPATVWTLSQWGLISDMMGNMYVNFVGRFENLKTDFEAACHFIGLPKLELPLIGKTNPVEHGEWTNESIDTIRTICSKEIQYFNYTFAG